MLCGPSGIGKMNVARAFVQYAHCASRADGESCGRCPSCVQHQSFNHPDIHFIYPIVKNKSQGILISPDRIDLWKRMLTEYPSMPQERWLDLLDCGNSQPRIYVEDAENIIHIASLSTYSAKYRFFIIWLPEKLNPEAANKLLKVIEEPEEGTVFLLVSNTPGEVLPTISSRTQIFNMSRLSDDEVLRYMVRKFHLGENEALPLARLAEGRIAKADELGEHTGERNEFGQLFREIMRAAYAKRPAKLREIGDNASTMGREKIRRFLDYMNTMARENFIYNLKMPQLWSMTPEEEQFSTRFSPYIHHGNVEEITAEIDRAKTDIERNGNSKVVLFSLFLLIIPLIHRKAPD